MTDKYETQPADTNVDIYPPMESDITEEALVKTIELLSILELDEYETDPAWWALRLFFTKS